MLHKPLPGAPDYQQLYNEAKLTASHYQKAYFDLLDRYCDMVDMRIAEIDRKCEGFEKPILKRPIDPFILSKIGRKSEKKQQSKMN